MPDATVTLVESRPPTTRHLRGYFRSDPIRIIETCNDLRLGDLLSGAGFEIHEFDSWQSHLGWNMTLALLLNVATMMDYGINVNYA